MRQQLNAAPLWRRIWHMITCGGDYARRGDYLETVAQWNGRIYCSRCGFEHVRVTFTAANEA